MLLSYLIIPTVILLLVLNIVFRVKIIRQYKALQSKRINIESKLLLDRKKLRKYAADNYPENELEIMRFNQLLRTLIFIAVGGFLIILIIFLIMKFS